MHNVNLERQLLDRASRAAAEEPDPAVAVARLLSDLRTLVPYDSVSVQKLRGSRLVIVGGVGFRDLDVIVGESFDVDNSGSPNGEVVHRRRPMIVRDTEQYRAFRRGLHVGSGIRSWLGIPLLHGGRVVGIVALDKAEADYYDGDHLRIAAAFAEILAPRFAELHTAVE